MNKENESLVCQFGSITLGNSPVKQEDNQQLQQVAECKSPTVNRPFVLKKWNPIAVWDFDIREDTCAICRVPLMEECLQHQEDPFEREYCIVYEGLCGHCFHNCCVLKWIKIRRCCPLCSEDWVILWVYRRPTLPEDRSTSSAAASESCVPSSSSSSSP